MNPLQTYDGQSEYFSHNRSKMISRYSELHENFKNIYDDILCNLHCDEKRNANGLVLILRASTYLNTTHELVLLGHIEEARILLRNPIELLLISFLMIHSEQVYQLWLECNDLRTQNTDNNGLVDIASIKDKRFNINEILKLYGGQFKDISIYSELIKLRGVFSTYYSHENLYNIVARIDQEEGKISLYIGQDAESDNDRVIKIMFMINDLLKSAKSILDIIRK